MHFVRQFGHIDLKLRHDELRDVGLRLLMVDEHGSSCNLKGSLQLASALRVDNVDTSMGLGKRQNLLGSACLVAGTRTRLQTWSLKGTVAASDTMDGSTSGSSSSSVMMVRMDVTKARNIFGPKYALSAGTDVASLKAGR